MTFDNIREFLDKKDNIYFVNAFAGYYKAGLQKSDEINGIPHTYEEYKKQHEFACDYVRHELQIVLEILERRVTELSKKKTAEENYAITALLASYFAQRMHKSSL